MKLTIEEFDKIAYDFLNAEDDESEDEYFTTERRLSERTLERLRDHLFAEEIAKEKRRQQYLELKAEFDPERKTKRLSACYLPPEEPLE